MTRLVYTEDNFPLEREDGTKWPFIMLRNNKAICADTRTELVGALIPGYDDISVDADGDDAALVERFKQALVTADFLQEFLAGVAANDPENEFSLAEATEEELTAFLTKRIDRPTEILGIDHWEHDIPLILVTTLFEPFDEGHPIPTGNIMWIDPSDETTYLRSLAELGQIQLFVAD